MAKQIKTFQQAQDAAMRGETDEAIAAFEKFCENREEMAARALLSLQAFRRKWADCLETFASYGADAINTSIKLRFSDEHRRQILRMVIRAIEQLGADFAVIDNVLASSNLSEKEKGNFTTFVNEYRARTSLNPELGQLANDLNKRDEYEKELAQKIASLASMYQNDRGYVSMVKFKTAIAYSQQSEAMQLYSEQNQYLSKLYHDNIPCVFHIARMYLNAGQKENAKQLLIDWFFQFRGQFKGETVPIELITDDDFFIIRRRAM